MIDIFNIYHVDYDIILNYAYNITMNIFILYT